MPKTFTSGSILPASDLNTNMVQPGLAATGTRIVAGITAGSFSTQSEIDVTISYGFTFSAAPKVVAVVQIGSLLRVGINWNTAPGVSSASAHLFQVAGTNITGTANIHWIAIGPP